MKIWVNEGIHREKSNLGAVEFGEPINEVYRIAFDML